MYKRQVPSQYEASGWPIIRVSERILSSFSWMTRCANVGSSSADESGIIITDGFDCLEVQPAPLAMLAGQRRNYLTRRLAHVAMRRIEFSIAAGLDVEIDEFMADKAAGALPA